MLDETDQRSLDDWLHALDAEVSHGWANDGAGTISVTLAADAEISDVGELSRLAEEFGYQTVFHAEYTDGRSVWHLVVSDDV